MHRLRCILVSLPNARTAVSALQVAMIAAVVLAGEGTGVTTLVAAAVAPGEVAADAVRRCPLSQIFLLRSQKLTDFPTVALVLFMAVPMGVKEVVAAVGHRPWVVAA